MRNEIYMYVCLVLDVLCVAAHEVFVTCIISRTDQICFLARWCERPPELGFSFICCNLYICW